MEEGRWKSSFPQSRGDLIKMAGDRDDRDGRWMMEDVGYASRCHREAPLSLISLNVVILGLVTSQFLDYISFKPFRNVICLYFYRSILLNCKHIRLSCTIIKQIRRINNL